MLSSLSVKKKFISDGVFFSEINEFLSKELSESGYSGVDVEKSPLRTEIIIKTTKAPSVIGYKGRRIRELSTLIKDRFNFNNSKIALYVEKVLNRGLCPNIQAELLRFKLLKGLTVRKACYAIVRSVMESGAKGCTVTVSGKLRAQRAKSMKFMDGYMIHSGQPVDEYVKSSTKHCLLPQGMIGIKVSIMLPWDPTGVMGPKKPLPDLVTILEGKVNF
jgi:small subunit ribosomal protein S3e|mmetsp:Transcript_58864/g.86271  ORF Transcript_58864/g.86271 Transcript_58864/m.86271 type:complete len:218 (-) Transcript_58864:336-989(-)